MKVIVVGGDPISFSECIRMRNEIDEAIARYGKEIVDKAFKISQQTPYPWKDVLEELLMKGENGMERLAFDRWNFGRLVDFGSMYQTIRNMLPAPNVKREPKICSSQRIESRAMDRYRSRRRKLNQISRASRAFNFRKTAA